MDCFDFVYGYVCICVHSIILILICLILLTANPICLGIIFGFLFGDICFNLTECHNKPLVESSFLNSDQAQSLWSGSTDSDTLDYQRSNPRGHQIVRTHTKETTGIQDTTSPNHPVQDASSKQQTKQKYKPNHQQTGLPPHSALPIRVKTNKNTAQISLYRKLTQTTGPNFGRQKPKGRKNSIFFKERIQLSLKPAKRRPQTQ